MLRGEVDFFNDTGGYGFIESDDVDEAVFFHMEDIDGPDLKEGEQVEFEVEYAEKGPRTTKVRRTPTDRVRGEVDFFNDTGGYGFIESDDVDEAVFFHTEDIAGPDLAEGEVVEFEVEQAEKGPRAINVQRDPRTPGGGADNDTDVYGGSGSSGTADGRPTDVYEAGGSRGTADDTHTEVYGESDSDSTGVFDGQSQSYCPNCGESLTAYPDPDFCPGCGDSLSPGE